MSRLRQQCDFMSNVVQHAIILGMSREQFDKLAETAWLVLTAEQPNREWLIRKRGYYYRPDRAGYTPSVFEAGRYTEAEAKAEATIEPSSIQAIPFAQALRDATTPETGVTDA